MIWKRGRLPRPPGWFLGIVAVLQVVLVLGSLMVPAGRLRFPTSRRHRRKGKTRPREGRV